MIVISGQLTVRPDRRDRAVEAVTALVTATREEAGCADYRFSSDLHDPNIFYFFERWESEEEMKAHSKSQHMADFMGAAPELLAGPAGATQYEISSSTPLF